MLKIILTVGIPASGKSTWAKSEIAKDPSNWVRINNDDIRSMFNGSVYSFEYEKIITSSRNILIKECLKKNKNIIIDNVNSNKRHFEDVLKLAKASGKEVLVMEKPFYIELEDAILRDSQRTASVGKEVIKKFYNDLGKTQFKFYKPKQECVKQSVVQKIEQNSLLPKAIIVDIDGTIAEISHRNPYDASLCLDDGVNEHVLKTVLLYRDSGSKVIFLSGRDSKYRDLTKEWLNTFVGGEFELFMRPEGNSEKDFIIKNNIFNEEVKGKYFVELVIDDRLQVCELWHELGLPLMRVGDPNSNF